MKFENGKAFNFINAFVGMRNPMNSWDKSDSGWIEDTYENECKYGTALDVDIIDCKFLSLGPKDIELAQKLIKAGSEHRKFMRQIFVSIDITAPLYWWKEMDTYKVATTTNSCSTMHKLASTPITLDCFEIDDYNDDLLLFDKEPYNIDETVGDGVEYIINMCETLRKKYLETKDIKYWKELIRWLPEGWLQKRTWTADYETLLSIVHQRSGHKLSEWQQFINYIKTLPYANELLFIDKE